jgi:DNA-binding CsgD family transcriptional regulator
MCITLTYIAPLYGPTANQTTFVGRQAGDKTMLTQNDSGPVASFQSSVPANGYPVTATPPAARCDAASAELNSICMSLTARQRDVLAVMMQGKSNKAICRILNLAEPTVKNHVTAILKALKVTNRTEAVIRVARASAASMSYSYTISGYSTFLHK